MDLKHRWKLFVRYVRKKFTPDLENVLCELIGIKLDENYKAHLNRRLILDLATNLVLLTFLIFWLHMFDTVEPAFHVIIANMFFVLGKGGKYLLRAGIAGITYN